MSASAQSDVDHGADGVPNLSGHDTKLDICNTKNDSLDLIAGLWQEAPFARLPDDAPPELREFVQDVGNPYRLYAIHRASRRHDFQSLVDGYIFQLRYGCGSSRCTTSTCFTCRKRLTGKSPIRRYNPTSARTLAVYLASQDNPDRGLCPYLERSNEPPPAFHNLIFSAQRPRRGSLSNKDVSKNAGSHFPRKGSPAGEPKSTTTNPVGRRCHVSIVETSAGTPPREVKSKRDDGAGHDGQNEENKAKACCQVNIAEKPVSRDYRSFAATAFGTVAFKMLEWLTPQSLQAISENSSSSAKQSPILKEETSTGMATEMGTNDPKDVSEVTTRREESQPLSGPRQPLPPTELSQDHHQTAQPPSRMDESKPPREPSRRKRNSNSSAKSGPVPKPQMRPSLESGPPAVVDERKQPKANNFQGDRKPRTARLAPGVIGRTLPEIPLRPAFFENVPCPSPPPADEGDIVACGRGDVDLEYPRPNSSVSLTKTRKNKQSPDGQPKPMLEPNTSLASYPLPQALCQLNIELVDFICDTFEEDRTGEEHFYGHRSTETSYPKPFGRRKRLARVSKQHSEQAAVSSGLWKAFNEQSIFTVMSDPHSLVKSFTMDGSLYDSQTLWYCMLRMTRAAPSLVLHCLWLSATSLFEPPQSLRSGRLPCRKLFGGKSKQSLSNFEAGCIMSICLHALVAAAPYASDSKTLYEMSRVRSNGHVLAGHGASARQPSPMCLEYDDSFSNELALRLARRLFCGITAWKGFADIAECDDQVKDAAKEIDILRPLLNQLDLVGNGPTRILEFSPSDRLLHETRVPTLLLDWARAVLLEEWNGEPEYSSDGPFHGAMSLISTLHENRNMLLLGDVQFRVDYFSERLDAMHVPVAWVALNSTRQRRHILDHPYLFSPDTLVSFFRSINFSRMSRTYEESASLKARMTAIVDPGSLVTNAHHKRVLQDLLKTASSRYLVLAISRKHVLRDAFDQLWRRQERELLRPLKVHLGEGAGGEEGFDSGGVQQEFFRMAIAECLDPQYGAFTVDERTRMAWFVPGSLVEEWKFEMIGLLVSLAMYNGLTLPITFPKAMYRKLLGQSVEELHHIADGWPELASGLTSLQEWDEKDGLVEDIFARTYEFSVSAFGGDVTLPMTKSGSPWPQGIPSLRTGQGLAIAEEEAPFVTSATRDEYVGDYVRYLTDVSIRKQFLAFERGFRACLDAKSLTLLTPSILQSVVEGVQDIDILELRRHARYVGWDSSHHTVKDFWSIAKKYDDRMKRKLLEFVTASDRVPVGGMRNMQFVIQKNGEEEGEGGHLPTAYTCYGTLLLPEYRDKEVLRERLGMALDNAQGFGFA